MSNPKPSSGMIPPSLYPLIQSSRIYEQNFGDILPVTHFPPSIGGDLHLGSVCISPQEFGGSVDPVHVQRPPPDHATGISEISVSSKGLAISLKNMPFKWEGMRITAESNCIVVTANSVIEDDYGVIKRSFCRQYPLALNMDALQTKAYRRQGGDIEIVTPWRPHLPPPLKEKCIVNIVDTSNEGSP
ncbi:hypothetical protein ACOMHN_001840 [Nucella lapillus]